MKNVQLFLGALVCALLLSGCPEPNDSFAEIQKNVTPNLPVTYTVIFEIGGGNPIQIQTITANGTAIRPKDPQWKGEGELEFVNWYADESREELYEFDKPVNGDITIYAGWKSTDPSTYIVYFDTDGGTPKQDIQSIAAGGKVSRPGNPSKEGFEFDNWYTNKTDGTEYNFDAMTISENTVIYARWTRLYTVTFETAGGTPDLPINPQEKKEGEYATRPESNPSKTGYRFDGWYKTDGIKYDFESTPITGDITLIAKWTRVYTVTFDARGGTATPSQRIIDEGKVATSPNQTPPNGDLSFGGWYNEEDDTKYDFNTPVHNDITLYAKWYDNLEKVNWDTDGEKKVIIDLDGEGNNWETLLSEIKDLVNPIELNLSKCVMDGTTFDPGDTVTGKDKIKSLKLPDAAKSIKHGTSGNPTFKYFTALEEISSSSIRTIGNYAFYGTTSLKTVDFQEVRTIGSSAFSYCVALETVDFSKVRTIDSAAFSYCIALETVTFPATTIGSAAFSDCSALKTVTFPEATTIGANAFDKCRSLETATFSEVDTIGEESFSGCTALRTVNVSNATKIGRKSFSGCTSLRTLNIPDVTDIGEESFSGCTNLYTVTITEAKTIGNSAFSGCYELLSLDMPNVTTVGERSFSGCKNLREVQLLVVTSIGNFAFQNIDRQPTLAGITFINITFGETPPTIGTALFSGVTSKIIYLTVPSNARSAYDNDTWKQAFKGEGTNGTGQENQNITLIFTP
ncbi:hypothetical protein PilKf_00834 [Pillotina sp. SPG140]|jgi:uncharacterized repeat protein (TIGR02543 family)